MEIILKRIAKRETYTIGRVTIDGKPFSDSIEDKDRKLNMYQSTVYILQHKVAGHTAIPTGRYRVKWTYSPRFKRNLPLVDGVPGFEGVRFHSGNTAEDSAGCIILGENKVKGKVLNSRETCEKFFKIVRETVKREEVWLTIVG